MKSTFDILIEVTTPLTRDSGSRALAFLIYYSYYKCLVPTFKNGGCFCSCDNSHIYTRTKSYSLGEWK